MANYQSAYTGTQHDAYATRDALVNLIYPVGALYMSTSNTEPSTLFGGTWERIQDRFLMCAGSTYTAGATGGAATHTHTTASHTLTINEIPAHNHDNYQRYSAGTISGWAFEVINASNTAWLSNNKIRSAGGGRTQSRKYRLGKYYTTLPRRVRLEAYRVSMGGVADG